MTERTHNRFSCLVAKLVQYHVKLVPCFQVLLAAKSDRGLTNFLDQLKRWFTLLLTQGIAQHSAQQPNIFSKGIILDHRVFIQGLILAEVFALGSEECHNATSSRKSTLRSVVCASIRLGARHAKMSRWK